MPRAADAYATADKRQGWILAAAGHREEWARVFPDPLAVIDAPVSVVHDRAPHGVVRGVDITLTINDLTAWVAMAWHYSDADAAPRLVTAYPSA